MAHEEAQLEALRQRRIEITARIAELVDDEASLTEQLAEHLALGTDAAMVDTIRERRAKVRSEREDLESALGPLDAKIKEAERAALLARFHEREQDARAAWEASVRQLRELFGELEGVLARTAAFDAAYDAWRRRMRQGSRAAGELKQAVGTWESKVIHLDDPLEEVGAYKGWRRDLLTALQRAARARAREAAEGMLPAVELVPAADAEAGKGSKPIEVVEVVLGEDGRTHRAPVSTSSHGHLKLVTVGDDGGGDDPDEPEE